MNKKKKNRVKNEEKKQNELDFNNYRKFSTKI